MLEDLLSFDPDSISAENRAKMAAIINARSEYLVAAANLGSLRAREWGGEEGLSDFIELQAVELAKVRLAYMEQAREFIKSSFDVDQFKGLLPMVLMGAMRCLKVPAPVLMEALGLDFDNFKTLADALKELFESDA